MGGFATQGLSMAEEWAPKAAAAVGAALSDVPQEFQPSPQVRRLFLFFFCVNWLKLKRVRRFQPSTLVQPAAGGCTQTWAVVVWADGGPPHSES